VEIIETIIIISYLLSALMIKINISMYQVIKRMGTFWVVGFRNWLTMIKGRSAPSISKIIIHKVPSLVVTSIYVSPAYIIIIPLFSFGISVTCFIKRRGKVLSHEGLCT
jgi:hypothetical protein